MSKKILVVTGSPRHQGNTDILAQAFIEGAKDAGNEVFLFDAGKALIKGCNNCNSCFGKGGQCQQNDDMQKIYPLLHECDVLVFASPIYFFTVSAQLKVFIDRMYCSAFKPFAISGTVLLTVQQDRNPAVADNAINTYKSIINYIGWKDLGVIAVTNVDEAGAIIGNPKLEEARALGASI
ncbi:MAG: flavodoxin family protein [Eggerthellaceae bacterium]|nr:flavodoxin family protein [Eggerthellaceae bacterium]